MIAVDHGNGLRSSISGVAELTVARGTPVAAGQPVAIAAAALDVSLRAGNAYIEPTSLWSVGANADDPPAGAQLVPVPR